MSSPSKKRKKEKQKQKQSYSTVHNATHSHRRWIQRRPEASNRRTTCQRAGVAPHGAASPPGWGQPAGTASTRCLQGRPPECSFHLNEVRRRLHTLATDFQVLCFLPGDHRHSFSMSLPSGGNAECSCLRPSSKQAAPPWRPSPWPSHPCRGSSQGRRQPHGQGLLRSTRMLK